MKSNIFEEKEILEYSKACFYGTDQRTQKFDEYQSYYYWGGKEVKKESLKRLFGEINTIVSLIYTPSSMIVDPVCDEKLNPEQRAILDAIVQEIYDNFITYNRLDVEIEDAILHALIYGYTPIKVFWKGNGVLYKEIDPRNFGICYESLDISDRQQIIGHKTYMTKDKIKFLYGVDIEREAQIIEQKVRKSDFATVISVAKQKAVIDATGSISFEKYWEGIDAKPLEEVREIYINEYYRTSKDIWHKFVVIPRFNLIVEHSKLTGINHPFFILSIFPKQGSSLGISLIELIKEVQDKRVESLEKIANITNLRTYPPMVIRGAAISPDQVREDIEQLWTEKGYMTIQDPQSVIDTFPPQTGLSELYEMLEYWNMQVRFITGLFEIVLGEGQRTKMGKGMELLAAFATSPFRRIAHRIETVLEDIFTYSAYLYRLNSNKQVRVGDKFYSFSDFPFDFRINIRSHTASPIDLKIIQDLFFAMYKMGDIPADMLFDLFNLPFKHKYLEFKEKKQASLILQKMEEKAEKEDQSKS